MIPGAQHSLAKPLPIEGPSKVQTLGAQYASIPHANVATRCSYSVYKYKKSFQGGFRLLLSEMDQSDCEFRGNYS